MRCDSTECAVNSPRALLTVDHVCRVREPPPPPPTQHGRKHGRRRGASIIIGEFAFPSSRSRSRSSLVHSRGGREGGRRRGYLQTTAAGYVPTGPSRCVEWRFLRTSSHPPILESALTRHHPKMKLYLPVPTYVWHVDEGATAYNVPACLPFGRRDSGLGIEDCNASLNAFNAIVQSKASVRPPPRRPLCPSHRPCRCEERPGERGERAARAAEIDGYRSHFWVTDWMDDETKEREKERKRERGDWIKKRLLKRT